MQGANGIGIKGIQQLPLATNIKLEGKSALKDASRSEFLEKFEKIKSENVKEELENIFGKITEQADKIGEKMYLKDILEYKKLVKEFLNVATQNSHQFQNQNFLDRRGRHRNYSIVKTVDRELDTLTREFINGQIDHMGVLKKIDDIRGMLLDIMM
ncbi:YaaR family protein [Acetoanaerobium noterae]|uniref:YaaR family protein n=1 Tax=Acetoanaerobium noterae TaxID=745369 RepID=UPI0028A84FED|nr:YaaR family protein [Acetoanaerobium noterae]